MRWLTILVLAMAVAASIVAALSYAAGRHDEGSPIFSVIIPDGCGQCSG
jgi:hypothetical protein